ncbi:MAG: ribosomal protein S18-alanine N-acetyltransferase [Spirochaetota bacterium]
MTEDTVIIRNAGVDDIEDVHTIEMESFESPWNYKNILHELNLQFSIFIVACINEDVAGYAIAWQVQNEIQLNKIAVKRNYKRQGIGKRLLEKIIDISDPPVTRVFLEVRETNAEAQLFYRKLGFTTTGFRKDYYKTDNAILMEKRLPANEDQ